MKRITVQLVPHEWMLLVSEAPAVPLLWCCVSVCSLPLCAVCVAVLNVPCPVAAELCWGAVEKSDFQGREETVIVLRG